MSYEMIHTLGHIEPDYGLAVDPFVEWNEIHRPLAVELARVRAAEAHFIAR